jgi:NAD(P)-dependent dehydrogenase (short-subunit alcohol dehydrogenase family)
MRFPLSEETVVVVAGGSSGVGRAIALEFARKGVHLILASRDLTALEGAAVEELRDTAVGEFGRIDVWVNCAALLLFGRFEELPAADFRRVVDANLMAMRMAVGWR